MHLKVARLNFFARLAGSAAFALVCLAAAPASRAQVVRDPQPPIRRGPLPPVGPRPIPTIKGDPPPGGGPSPTMKKPEKSELLPPRERRSYDAKRDATYVNVGVTLLAHASGKDQKGALAFAGREVTLTFQLAYRGAHTYDLISSYLIVESTALPADGDKLAALCRLDLKADDYEYSYERLDYQTEQLTLPGAAAQQLRREVAAFRLPPEDLPQLASAGRLRVRLGGETYTLKSYQLNELRRTLAAGER